MREHEPELFARLRRMLNPKDYLRLRLTGEHVTDVSDASGTGLFDVRNRRWSRPLMRLLDLPESILPEVVESSDRTGVLLPDLAARWGLPPATPVFGGGGDSVIQTTSMGVIDSGPLGVTLGTAGIVAGGMRSCPVPTGQLQISCGNAPGRWHVMGVTLTAGGAFEWLKQALASVSPATGALSFERMISMAREAPAGSGGLLFLPYLLGERCPHVAADGRAAWIGLTSMHGGPHLVRSVMEGVLLNIRTIAALCVSSGLACDEIRASGGAMSEPFWSQLLADVLQREVTTVTGAAEGGAYGAVLAAGVGSGWWTTLDEAVATLEVTSRTAPDRALDPLYASRFSTFRGLYDALQPVMAQIAAEAAPTNKNVPLAPTSPIRGNMTTTDAAISAGTRVAGIVFDLDGTLVDTAPDITSAVNRMLATRGLPPQEAHFVEQFIGEGSYGLIDKLYKGLGLTLDQARVAADVETYLTLYKQHPVEYSTVYQDALHAIPALHAAGIVLGVCTNKGAIPGRSRAEAFRS